MGYSPQGCKELDIVHARRGVWAIVLQVAVVEGYEPEDGAKGQPGEDVGQREDYKHVAPLGVHEGGEDVHHVAAPLPENVLEVHVAAAVLVQQTPPRSALLGQKVLRRVPRALGVHAHDGVAAAVVGHALQRPGVYPGDCRGSKGPRSAAIGEFGFFHFKPEKQKIPHTSLAFNSRL